MCAEKSIIRQATIIDIDRIYKIGKNNLPIYYDRSELLGAVKEENNIFLVANKVTTSDDNKNRSKIVGYCYASIKNSIRIHILSFAVDSKFRNQKYGTKMMEHLTNIADSKNMKFISLFVKETNDSARKFYEKNGFIYKKNIDNYYGKNDHCCVYIKLLQELQTSNTPQR